MIMRYKMTIFTDTFIPYVFKTKYQALEYVVGRCQGLKHSLRLMEKDTEHLTFRCPVSGDCIDVVGEVDELRWLDEQLCIRKWYRIT